MKIFKIVDDHEMRMIDGIIGELIGKKKVLNDLDLSEMILIDLDLSENIWIEFGLSG
jgi:hypothetical protein